MYLNFTPCIQLKVSVLNQKQPIYPSHKNTQYLRTCAILSIRTTATVAMATSSSVGNVAARFTV